MISVSFLFDKHADVVNVVKKVKLDNQGFEIRIRTDAFNAVMICDVVFKNKLWRRCAQRLYKSSCQFTTFFSI